MAQLVHRQPHGSGFTYKFLDGKTLKRKEDRHWINSLAIPPAWTKVEIDLNRQAKIHATGRDNKGRKQYLYNPAWSEKAQKENFERILRFAQQLETMRRVTGQHLRERPITRRAVLACMTRMLDEAYFRPGSESYTRNNGTYGLTTLRSKHLSFKDGQAEFHYIGKSQQEQTRNIADGQIKKILKELDDMPGYELFDITDDNGQRTKLTSADLNDYIASVMGEDFSAKDFRTWAGTLLMAKALDELGPATDQKLAKSNVVQAVKSVAEDLGNTPAITRENYIHPEIITKYEDGQTLDYFRRQLQDYSSEHCSLDEAAAMHLLKQAVN